MSRHTLVSVADAEAHSTRRFCTLVSRPELDALLLAADQGRRGLPAREGRRAETALTKLVHAVAQADLNKRQREAGIPPKRRHARRA
jgi:hypothetical protein